MAIVRATIGLSAASGIPADIATNTFHFDCTGLSSPVLDNVVDLIEDLYFNETDAFPLRTWMCSDTGGTNYGIKLYNLADPEPRSPIREKFGTWNPAITPGLPSEVALVASFEAAPASGQNQARRRGRIYIPFLGSTTNSGGRPTSSIVTGVAEAMEEFWNAAEASLNVEWVVGAPRAPRRTPSLKGGWTTPGTHSVAGVWPRLHARPGPHRG